MDTTKSSVPFHLGLTVLILLTLSSLGDSVKLKVKYDSEAVIDSEISFHAWLESPERDSYDIEWNENYPRSTKKRYLFGTMSNTNNYQSNFTLPYNSSDGYLSGGYTVTVTVSYIFSYIYYVTVDTQILSYRITPTFQGKLHVEQQDVPKESPTFISTKKEAEFIIDISEGPSKYLETAVSVNYTWCMNNTIIANTTLPKLSANITKEGFYGIKANLTAEFNSTTLNGTTTFKNGTFDLNITAKEPIVNFGYTGATWFRHGKLLDLKVSCEGTPPYSYCWHIIFGPYNHTGNETCISPSLTNDCEFQIRRYFSDTGLYTLLILMKNDVSSFVNQSSINVYKSTHKPQLSIIIVPITCSVVAIVLVIFGVAYYWENQMRYTVEVADFDFGDSTGITQVTIIDRIRETIYTWRTRRGDNELLQSVEDESPVFGLSS